MSDQEEQSILPVWIVMDGKAELVFNLALTPIPEGPPALVIHEHQVEQLIEALFPYIPETKEMTDAADGTTEES